MRRVVCIGAVVAAPPATCDNSTIGHRRLRTMASFLAPDAQQQLWCDPKKSRTSPTTNHASVHTTCDRPCFSCVATALIFKHNDLTSLDEKVVTANRYNQSHQQCIHSTWLIQRQLRLHAGHGGTVETVMTLNASGSSYDLHS